MLVIERKIDQSLIITTPQGEKIQVTMVKIFERKAKVGIKAPENFRVKRIEDKK